MGDLIFTVIQNIGGINSPKKTAPVERVPREEGGATDAPTFTRT